jgi:hypothetical protein
MSTSQVVYDEYMDDYSLQCCLTNEIFSSNLSIFFLLLALAKYNVGFCLAAEFVSAGVVSYKSSIALHHLQQRRLPFGAHLPAQHLGHLRAPSLR